MLFKKVCFFLLFLSLTHLSQAAINPLYKECMQRGYAISGDHCVFPDSSRCLLEAFNDGECGQEWMTDDYCIEEGRYVWDEDRCCEGLVAYLPAGMSGQARCRNKNEVIKDRLSGGGGSLYLVLVLGLLAALLLLRFKGARNRNKKK